MQKELLVRICLALTLTLACSCDRTDAASSSGSAGKDGSGGASYDPPHSTVPAQAGSAQGGNAQGDDRDDLPATLARADREVQAHLANLRSAHASEPHILGQIAASQSAWERFVEAQAVERFPHQNEPGYYGTVLSTCLASERVGLLTYRAEQLAPRLCSVSGGAVDELVQRAKQADAELNSVYAEVRSKRARVGRISGCFESLSAGLASLQRRSR